MANHNPADELVARITRLEEAAAFAQHESEQLSSEIAALGKRLAELSRRIDTIEQREAARQTDLEEPPGAK
ncbi:MAG: SlyX family protein [Phycisphaeraceae bacterium]|nr:SlyX family protein [Phycisphaeraceae bacterium]MBX3407453.1 SlyX family protein [Phycisphaeraceae bacterium]